MSVTLVCPACDTEVPTDSTSGTVRCPTCWANVPVETARRKPTDTPPPRGPDDGIPVARKAGSPPRAKRATAADGGRQTRPRRPVNEGNGWVWAVAFAALVLAGVIGFVVFSGSPPEDPSPTPLAAAPPTAPAAAPDPDGEWVTVSTTDGATLLAPGPLTRQKVTLGGDSGVVHSATGGRFTAEVYVFDLKGDRRADTDEFVSGLLEVSPQRVLREGVRPIPGGDAAEYAASDVSGFDHVALILGRGGRLFVFHLQWKTEDDSRGRRRAAFVAKAGVNWLPPAAPAEPVRPADPKAADPKPKDLPPASPKPEAEPISETWVAIDNKAGFAAVAPKGARAERQFAEQKRLTLGGQRWQVEDGHCVYHVSYLDLPADFDPDVAKLLKSVLPFGQTVGAESDATVGGKKGTEWQLKQWDKVRAKAFTVRCGFRLFMAFAVSRNDKGYGEDATLTRRADKFAAGLRFTFDPKNDDPYAGEPRWATMPNTTAFTAKVPKGNTSGKPHDVGFNPKVGGKQYQHEAGGITFEVYVHDLPAKASSAAVVKELLGHERVVSGPEEVRSEDRRRWAAYELGSPERPTLVRAAAVGNRVITLKAYPDPRGDDRVGIREFRDKAAQFFQQFVAAD
jgi:hypothetical protein